MIFLLGSPRFSAPCRKGNLCIRYGNDSAVGDGDLMGIAPKIFDCIAKAVKGLFDKWTPVFPVKDVPEFLPFVRITQVFTGMGKLKLSCKEEAV